MGAGAHRTAHSAPETNATASTAALGCDFRQRIQALAIPNKSGQPSLQHQPGRPCALLGLSATTYLVRVGDLWPVGRSEHGQGPPRSAQQRRNCNSISPGPGTYFARPPREQDGRDPHADGRAEDLECGEAAVGSAGGRVGGEGRKRGRVHGGVGVDQRGTCVKRGERSE